MTETTMTIAKNLKFYMDRMGMKQGRLAEEAGIATTTVRNWMFGRRSPNIDQLERCAQALHVDLDDLISPLDLAAADEQTMYHAYVRMYNEIFRQENYLMPDQYAEVADNIMSGCLSDREKDILTLRYGLDNGGIRTLKEIGRNFKVTKERVRQIQEQALERLRGFRDELQINTLSELEEKKQDPESKLFDPQQMVMDGFGEVPTEQTVCADHSDERTDEPRPDSWVFDGSIYGLTWEDLVAVGTLDRQFSLRTSNCLKRNGVHSTFQLFRVPDQELKNFHGLGEKSFQEVQEVKKSLLGKMPFLKMPA